MIEKLKQLYGEEIIIEPDIYDFTNNYYFSNNNTIFSINKNAINDRELVIIESFNKRILTDKKLPNEKIFYDLVFKNKEKNIDKIKYKSVYISILEIDKESENDLKNDLIRLMKDIFIDGIIINEGSFFLIFTEVNINNMFNEVIEIIQDDFMMSVKALIGEEIKIDKFFSTKVNFYLNLFKNIKLKSDKPTINIKQLYKYCLISEVTNPIVKEIKDNVLKEYKSNDELLKIIEIFFSNNMNITETAKSLYVHRNTLQTKIDKFYNETGYDLRNVEDAFLIYWLLHI